jgi:putative membrane protein
MSQNAAEHRGPEPSLQGRSEGEQSFLLASRRTRLSFQRTRMSADRTLMAIIRTALSLISFGFTISQFFRSLRQTLGPGAIAAARNFGMTLIIIGVLLLAFGIWGHIRFMLELRSDHTLLVSEQLVPNDEFPYSITLGTAVLLLLVGLVAILSIALRLGPFR